MGDARSRLAVIAGISSTHRVRLDESLLAVGRKSDAVVVMARGGEAAQELFFGVYFGVCRKIEFIFLWYLSMIMINFESPLRTIS